MPSKLTDKRTKPDDVFRSVRAAFDAGADGVVLSREYMEMWLAHLSARRGDPFGRFSRSGLCGKPHKETQ